MKMLSKLGYFCGALISLSLLFVPGCSPDEAVQPSLVPPGAPVCEGGPDRPGYRIEPNVRAIGQASNYLRLDGEYLWIVESQSNTVSRLALGTGQFASGFLDVGSDRNPYQVAVDERHAFVSNYLGGSLTRFDRATGRRISELKSDRFVNPSGVSVAEGTVFVSHIHFAGADGFGRGTVTAVDKDTEEIIGEWETAGKNPQFLAHLDDPGLGGHLFVVNTGAVAYVDGRFRSTSTPSIEKWSFDDDLTLRSRELLLLETSAEVAVASPGELVISSDQRTAYLAGATEPLLYKVDLETMTWIRGPENPIRINDLSGDALHHATMDERGIVYVTSFNEDALYLFDSTCDEKLAGPIDLGQSSTLLEGPHGIAIHGSGDRWQGYFAMSLSNVLGFVEFFW